MATISRGRDWGEPVCLVLGLGTKGQGEEMRGAADSGSSLAHDLLFAVAPVPIVENTMKTRVIACDDTVREY
jgi:hypothetical protein